LESDSDKKLLFQQTSIGILAFCFLYNNNIGEVEDLGRVSQLSSAGFLDGQKRQDQMDYPPSIYF
jgi:hypothetical protein